MSGPQSARDFTVHWLEDMLADAGFEEVRVARVASASDAMTIKASRNGEIWFFGIERFPAAEDSA